MKPILHALQLPITTAAATLLLQQGEWVLGGVLTLTAVLLTVASWARHSHLALLVERTQGRRRPW